MCRIMLARDIFLYQTCSFGLNHLSSFLFTAFASALCFLYDENYEFESSDVISILAAAHFLQIESLKQR